MGRSYNPVFGDLGTTIFTVMSALALKSGAVNLGQGFPDEDGPASIRAEAARVLHEGPNQYPPMTGLPQLKAAVADHSARFHGLSFNPASEVLITSGATEALTASIMALAAPGDEAIIIEPAYDSYRPALEAVCANVRAIRLQPPHFKLEEAALAEVFSPRTKLLIINSPLNPVGRVLTQGELELIAAYAKRYDSYVICDEVYEHLVFDGHKHVPLMSLPGMRERCVRIGSAGKIFSLTGWKVGWVQGPAPLIGVIAKAHQFLTFTTPPALQLGIAHGLTHEMNFALNLTRALESNRDFLSRTLTAAGFQVLSSEGTYFVTAGIRNLTNESDRDFCERMTRDGGVAAIPISAFYASGGPTDLVRFAFCKKREILEDAAHRLQNFFAVQPA